MDYAIPSSRFERKQVNAPKEPMNFYAPPKNTEFSNSGASNAGVSPDAATPIYAKPAPAAARPGAVDPSVGKNLSYISAAQAGLQNSQTPATTDTSTQVMSVLGNTAAGALSGAAAGAAIGGVGAVPGAIIGGGIALVSSGLNAWSANKQARAERDKQAALTAEANRIRQEEVARNEKWMKINHLASIEAAAEDRRRYNQNVARQNMIDTSQKLQAALANNASLRDHWAKYGFN